MTDTEQQIRDLCTDARIKVLSVERTATQWIVTVAPFTVKLETIYDCLHDAMKARDQMFSLSHSDFRDELVFGEMK